MVKDGNSWPFKRPNRDPGDAFPWSVGGFEGLSQSQTGWHAWVNAMPPGPPTIHVVGEVLVSNPGVIPLLNMIEPQGINPAILLLDLSLIQSTGMHPQVIVNKQVTFERKMPKGSIRYTSVQIMMNGHDFALIDHISIYS